MLFELTGCAQTWIQRNREKQIWMMAEYVVKKKRILRLLLRPLKGHKTETFKNKLMLMLPKFVL